MKPGQEELALQAGTPDQNGKDCDILGITAPLSLPGDVLLPGPPFLHTANKSTTTL